MVVQPQLSEGAALGDALESLLGGLRAGVGASAWYFAPQRPNSLPKALSVSVSAACCGEQVRELGAARRRDHGGGGGRGAASAAAAFARAVPARRRASDSTDRAPRATRSPQRAAPPDPAVRGHGSQSGAKARPNTSAAARRTSGRRRGGGRAVGPEECAVTDDVDDARHAARQAEHLAQRPGSEDIGGGARDAQPVAHVGGGLLARQRVQVIAAGDALRELAQLVARQQLAQLRLADEDDLQELLRVGLEVGDSRTCSSTSEERFCASSTTSTTRRPAAWARSR